MLAFAIVVVLGVAIGLARSGSLGNLTAERLALVPLVWVAVGLQLGAQFIPAGWSMVAYGMVIVSYAALFAFAGANWRVAGMLLIAIGAGLNYAVILANQGMPISAEAAARAGFAGTRADELVLRGKHFIASGEPNLSFLGDVIPLWRQPAVASVGDLIIWAGLLLVIQALMQPRRRGSVPRRRSTARPEEIDLRDDVGTHRARRI